MQADLTETSFRSINQFKMRVLNIVRHRKVAKEDYPALSKPKAPAKKKVLRFDAALNLGAPDAKKFDEVKDGDVVVDYKDVRIKGYLSTFKNTTESDRDGDYVEPGAFKETIPTFMQNPVLLTNHRNDVQSIAGLFDIVREDDKGLYVEAKLSDSPADHMKDIRFKVAEGSLKTLSMGGLFHYKEDGRGIFKVNLWEGSLTPIPANPDAIISTRALNEAEVKKAELDC